MKAFVLSGGGNLGSLQAGMLRALLEAGIVPDVLVGTSIGSVNAAFLAADPSLEQAESLCRLWVELRSREIFSRNPLGIGVGVLRRGALFSSGRWRRFLQRRIPYEQIEEAAIPLRITATDLADGAPVIFDSGSVLDAVMASTSLPGVWPPYRIGEHHYLDGALSDPVSLKPAIDAGADTIYVLAVSASYPPPDHRSARAVLRHTLTILLFPRVRLDAIGLPDGQDSLRIIKIPSGGAQVSLTDMSRHGDLIEQGHRETARFLADQGSGSHDRDASQITIMPELTVDAERHEEVTSETRAAADPRTQS